MKRVTMMKTANKKSSRRYYLICVLSIIFGCSLVSAQDTTLVSGIIVSPYGEPLANVTISIAGSSQMPFVTNKSGEFSIKAPPGSDWIIITPTRDYKTKKIFLNNRTALQVHLTPSDVPSGDDEFTISSMEMKRKDIVGAFSELNNEESHHNAAMSVEQLMAGTIAGLHVTNTSGMPGSGASLSLRGTNSFYASTHPLVVVDGIPMVSTDLFNSNLAGYVYNPFMEINPYDISSIVIVKDPSLTTIYGSKASNGIIYIETLDPSVTQTVIEVDYRNGLSLSPERYVPQLNASQHRTLLSEVLFTSDFLEEEILELYPSLFMTPEDDGFVNYQHDTKWQDLIFTNSLYNNFNLNVKGGDGIARYGLSFGYSNGNGIIKNTNYQGYNLRFVSLLNIFSWLKMNALVSLNYNSSHMKEAGSVNETSPIYTSLAKTPMQNPYQYDFDGNELITLADVDELGISNPLATINNFEARNNNYNFNTTLGFTGSISKNLNLVSKVSLLFNVLKEGIYMPNRGMELYFNNEARNVSKATNNSINSLYNNTFLVYKKQLGQNHQLTSNSGMHLQTNQYQLDWALTKNAHENDEYRSLQDGQQNLREIGGDNRSWNWISFYETLNYAYKDRYLATASISLDGSSRIGSNAFNTLNIGNAPFGLFYSAGLAWRLSEESFLQGVDWLEEMKIRISAGKIGNDDIGESSATNYYFATKFRETVGLYPATVPNYQLTYESVRQLNAGLDFSSAGNRFAVSVDYFISASDNLIVYSPLEAYFGYEFRNENGGKMQNNGLEVNAFLRLMEKGSFKWDMKASFSNVNNVVTEIKESDSYSILGGAKINTVGEASNSFYGYVYNGVFSTQLDADEAGLVNEKGIPFQAGDAIFEDISGPDGVRDSVINEFDKTTIGSSLPDYFGGIYNKFTYGRISLHMTWSFVYGNEIFNYVRYKNESMSTLANQSKNVLNRWQYEGQNTDVPRALWEDPIGNSAFSSRWIEDGSYVKLKNIALSYRIPDKFLVFRNAEFYISASNLITLSRYLGYDPEFSYSHSQIHRGIDYGLTPIGRQFIAGVKVGL